MIAPILMTDRLTLRPPALEDFDAYAEMMDSSRAQYMGQLSRRHAWYSFANDIAGWSLFGLGHWTILSDATHIGFAGFQKPDHFPEIELGWMLLDGFEGQGFATEAAEGALNWAQENRDVRNCVSYIDPANTASINVAVRLGAHQDPSAQLPIGETANDTIVYRHHFGRAI